MNSNGASIAQESHPYLMLWGLFLLYFVVAWILCRVAGLYSSRRRPALR